MGRCIIIIQSAAGLVVVLGRRSSLGSFSCSQQVPAPLGTTAWLLLLAAAPPPPPSQLSAVQPAGHSAAAQQRNQGPDQDTQSIEPIVQCDHCVTIISVTTISVTTISVTPV